MKEIVPQIRYWTKWRIAIEIIKFAFFLVLEVLVIYIIYIELIAILGGGGLPFGLPSNMPKFLF